MLKFNLHKLPFLLKETYTLQEVINLTNRNPNEKNLEIEDIYVVSKDFYSNTCNYLKAGLYTKQYIINNHTHNQGSFDFLFSCTDVVYKLNDIEQKYFTELKIIPEPIVEKKLENTIIENTDDNRKTLKNSFKK